MGARVMNVPPKDPSILAGTAQRVPGDSCPRPGLWLRAAVLAMRDFVCSHLTEATVQSALQVYKFGLPVPVRVNGAFVMVPDGGVLQLMSPGWGECLDLQRYLFSQLKIWFTPGP